MLKKTTSNVKKTNKKINDIIKDQTLTLSWFINGYKEIIKKTTKKTTPKLLFELI